jgi:hypothetical protein
MRRFTSPSSSVPSCTVPRHSTSLTSTSHRLLPRPYTQKKFSTSHAPSSCIPSAQTPNSLLGPSRRSSPRSFLPHGPSSSYWYVARCCLMWFRFCPLLMILSGLFSQWGAVRPGAPHLFSPSVLSFVLSLALIEGLLFWYWIELRLGQILLYGSGAATLTLLTGKQALAGIAKRRTRSG